MIVRADERPAAALTAFIAQELEYSGFDVARFDEKHPTTIVIDASHLGPTLEVEVRYA